MNQYPGVIGRKVGMTQIFNEDGSVVPCTLVEVRPVVVGKRTKEKDGYDAIILGLGQRKEKHLSKPLAGFFKKAGVAPARTLRELRCSGEYAAKFELGQEVKLDEVFSDGQIIDVQGLSKGHGFTGVMTRHNFAGGGETHGAHEYHRHGGSIGTNMTPGRTVLGRKMPGQHGNTTKSVLNQRVAKVLADKGLLLIHGGVPGKRDGLVVLRGAIKRRGGVVAAK